MKITLKMININHISIKLYLEFEDEKSRFRTPFGAG